MSNDIKASLKGRKKREITSFDKTTIDSKNLSLNRSFTSRRVPLKMQIYVRKTFALQCLIIFFIFNEKPLKMS